MKVENKKLIRLFIIFIFVLMLIPGISASDISQCNQINDISASDISQCNQINGISADPVPITVDDDYPLSSSMDSSPDLELSDLMSERYQDSESSIDEGIQKEGESTSIYVNASGGSDDNTGGDWNNAVQSVEKALNIADENGSIYFAEGTYNLASCEISKNINFIGQNSERTVFEGDDGQGLIISPGVSFYGTCLTFKNFNGENGSAINNLGILTLNDVLFINNQATNGGAIYLGNSTANIANSVFINNSATNGGAIYGFSNDGTVDVTITADTFLNNSATSNGGAIYLSNITDSTSIDNSLFVNNCQTSIFSNANLKIGENNWFGNKGTDTGLDSSLFNSEIIKPEKWLVLHLTTDDETVFLGGSVTVTCLFRDNEGSRVDGSDLPKDIKALFSVTGQDSVEKTLSNAKVTYTYTATVSGANVISVNIYGIEATATKTVFTSLDSVYVNISGGSNSNSGENWDNAVESIDYALIILNDNGIIYLADGIYHINNNAAKEITKNLTFIGESQNGTIIDGNYNFGYNISYGVTYSASYLTFRNFFDSDASSYGAVFEVMGTLNLDNVSFYNNSAPYSNGGAIDLANTGTGNLHITNSYFENNCAIEGGCISSYGFMDVDIINSTFVKNYVSWNGGAIAIKNGVDFDYSFNISGCRFIDNYCRNIDDGYGGAIYITASVASITDSIFMNNSAEWGGAIGSYTSYNLNIQKSLFLNNTNASRGGAIYLFRFTNPKINYNIFINNVASYDLNNDEDNSVIGFGENDDFSIENNWFGHTSNNSIFDTSIISNLKAPSEYLVLNCSCDSNILDLGNSATIRYDLTKTQLGNPIDASKLPVFNIPLESINGNTDVNELSFVNGFAKVVFNSTNAGNGAVIANFYDKNITTHFIINEPSIFTFSIADMTYGSANKLNISVPANATGSITVSLNGNNYTSPIENGYAIINIPDLDAGKYSILVSYSGNEEYPSFIKEANFTVKEINYTVKDTYSLAVGNLKVYYKYGTALVATLYKNGKPLSGAKLTYSFGSSKYTYNTNSLGQVKYVVTNLKPGTYNIKIAYGNISKTVKVTVKKVSVKYTKLTKTVKKGKYFKFKVLTKNNKVVKKQKVSIKIGKKTYKVKTDSKGIAKVKVKLNPKKYKVVIKLVSNAYYTVSKKTTKLRVKK